MLIENEYRNNKFTGKSKKVKRETIAKEAARLLLTTAPQKDAFHCRDGQVLHTLKELEDALFVMTDETYIYHLNSKNKDLRNWVRDIIGDVKLAKDLAKATSRSLAAWEVATRISYLDKQVP